MKGTLFMEYVINPSWFYWLNVVDAVRGVACAYVVLFAIAAIITLLTFFVADIPFREIEASRPCVLLSIGFVVAVLVLVFVPSKEALIEIQVARLATYDNVAMTVDGIKSVADYIVDAIKTISGG